MLGVKECCIWEIVKSGVSAETVHATNILKVAPCGL